MKINRREKQRLEKALSAPPPKLSEKDEEIWKAAKERMQSKENPKSLEGRVSPAPSDDSGFGDSDAGSVQSLNLENVYQKSEIDVGEKALLDDEQKHGDGKTQGKLSFGSEGASKAASEPKKQKAKKAAAKAAAKPALDFSQQAVEKRKLQAVGKFSALWKSPSSFVYEKGVGLRKATRYERFTNIFSGVFWGRTAASVARKVLMEPVGSKLHLSEKQVNAFLEPFSEGAEKAKKNDSLQVMSQIESFQGELAKKFLGMEGPK